MHFSALLNLGPNPNILTQWVYLYKYCSGTVRVADNTPGFYSVLSRRRLSLTQQEFHRSEDFSLVLNAAIPPQAVIASDCTLRARTFVGTQEKEGHK